MELNNDETYSYLLSMTSSQLNSNSIISNKYNQKSEIITDFGSMNMSRISCLSKNKIKTSISSKLISTFRVKQPAKTKQRKTFSFKSKLKCKIFEKKSFNLNKLMDVSQLGDSIKNDSLVREPKIVDSLSVSLYESLGKANNKEDLGAVVSAFYKIMDKSLGWLKIKSKTSNKKYVKSSFLYSSPRSTSSIIASLNKKTKRPRTKSSSSKKSSKIPLVKYINDKINKQTTTTLTKKTKSEFNFNYSTPKINEKCKMFLSNSSINENNNTKSYLFSAPSMSSSFNESDNYIQQAKFHSTPQSLYKQQVSPILYTASIVSASTESVSNSTFNSQLSTSSQFKSTPITSSSTSINKNNNQILSFTPNCSRRRLSFGVTSSPKSLDFSLTLSHSENNSCSIYTEPKSNYNDSILNNNNCNRKFDHMGCLAIQASANKVDPVKQQMLIDHINNIKQNVKLSYELRNLKSGSYYNNISDNFYNEPNVNKKSMLNKRKKLQKIFQIKLKKQLKEIKKWQNGVKNELDSNNNDLSVCTGSGSDCQHGYYTNSNESSISSNEYPKKANYYNSLNKVDIYCKCNCKNNDNKNFNYIENVNNYFNLNCN